MTVSELAQKLDLKTFCPGGGVNKPVKGAYCGDLLSLVMAKASQGDVWLTVHKHLNIIAVATLVDAACVIICEGIEPEQQTIEKARQHNVIVLGSALTSYELSWRIHEVFC